ncbi:MAG: hypothetical protein FJ308_05330 [Planctomycetes bacterium]|nr:hypothetical protein [Planctomycetota bacterium]
MSLSHDEVRSLCTKSELALVVASQSPALEKLSLAELKKHAANARKLTDKWQGLSGSESRTESRKSDSPDLDSRSHAKQNLLKETLATFEARLKAMESVPTVAPTTSKPSATVRAKAARVARQTTKKDLHRTKQSINAVAAPAPKTAAKPAASAAAKTAKKAKPKSAPVKKTTAAKAAATKAALVKTAAARAAKEGPAAAASASKPVPAKAASTKVKPSTTAQRTQLAGKAKANRAAISNRTSNIAGHVSGKGKRVQAKRDSKGR